MRQHRIERARGAALRQSRQRDDGERGRQALVVRPRVGLAASARVGFAALGERVERHQRAAAAPRIRFSGTMLGPSDGALVGIRVGLDEDAGDADRDRGARQHRHELALRRRTTSPCPPGCCTEWVASKITGAPVSRHDRQRAHVGDQRVVAEARRRAR